jgi:hypothetical protein
VTVTTMCTLTVGIEHLRAAILSTVVHADKVRLGDDDLVLARVRVIAAADELLVCATNGTSAALAACDIDDDSRSERFAADDGVFITDLHPAKARDLARMLKPTKDDDDTGWAELTFTDELLGARDVSGLWPGQSLTVPILAQSTSYPDVPAIIGRALAGAAGTFKPMLSVDRQASLFDVAGRVYGEPVIFEPTGTADSRGFVVLVGERFAGTFSSPHQDDNSLSRRDMQRHRHIIRLGLDKTLVG